MKWLVWRQHRGEGLVIGAAVLAVAAAFAVIRILSGRSYADLGLDGCDSTATEACRSALQAFTNSYGSLTLVVYTLLLLPVLLGMFVAAPLVAREFETGTFRFAWTQSATRSRWFWAKALAVAAGCALAAAGVTAAVDWALGPLVRVEAILRMNSLNSLTAPLFDASGIALVAATLLATAAGTLVGALTKRTVLAMVLTLAVFGFVRVPMNAFVRPNLVPPATATAPIGVNGNVPPDLPLGSWLIKSGFVDQQGNTYELLGMASGSCRQTINDATAFTRCMDGLGIRSYAIYQPPDRFWQFQALEGGVYVTLALVLLLAAWWHVRYRIA